MDVVNTEPPVSARSLAELREQHVALLGSWRSEMADAEKGASACALRNGAIALGALLEDAEERDTAQGVLDYWAAALAGLPGQAPPAPALLDPFDEGKARELAAKGEAVVGSLGEGDRNAADAMLLQLLRVDQSNRIVEGPAIPRGEVLWAGVGSGVIEDLAAAGILRIRSAPSQDETKIEFANRSVARRCPHVAELLAQRGRADTMRNRLRATARLWRQKDRAVGYLIGGASLEEAKQFLGDAEDNRVLSEFLEASIAKAKRDRMRLLLAIALGPLLVVGALAATGWITYDWGERVVEDRFKIQADETTVNPLSERRTDPLLVPAQSQPSPAIGPEGFVWIGSEDRPLLLDPAANTPVSPQSVHADRVYRVNAHANLRLRDGLPSPQYDVGARLGLAPTNSLIVALEEPHVIDRPSGQQYWVKIRVRPRVYITFGNASRSDNARLRGSLQERGFDVRPSESRPDYSGPNRVRFYYEQDRLIAQDILRIASGTLRGADGSPGPITCDLFTLPRPPLPTILEVWLGPGGAARSGRPGRAPGQSSCASTAAPPSVPPPSAAR